MTIEGLEGRRQIRSTVLGYAFVNDDPVPTIGRNTFPPQITARRSVR